MAAHLQSEPVDQAPEAIPRISTSGRWSNPPIYALDRDGPIFRPYQSMGDRFADIPVFDHLKGIASKYPEKLAISDGVSRLTYSELLHAVEILSSRIAAVVPEGDAVGILQADPAWYPVAMLAAMAVGRLSIPLNARDPGPRINEIIAAAQPVAIIGDGDVRHLVSGVDVQWIDVATSTALRPRRAPAAPLPYATSVDAPAIVLYTSGSTGRPKGIVNSQRSLLARVQQYVDACHIDAGDVFLPLTGPATIAGCREILAALLTGASLHLVDIEAVGLRAIRSRMKLEAVTITYLVPTLLRALMAGGATDALRTLRVARIGGEKVSWNDVALLRNAVSNGCLVQVGYSSTETTGSQWFLPSDWPQENAAVPVGRLLPGISFAIVDEEGRAVKPGQTGELVVKSPYVLLGYWQNGTVIPAQQDQEDPSLRIFATGDLVQLDDEGLLRIVGRRGRQIKVNGRRVEPAELERVLRDAPSVQDAVAIVTAAQELIAFAVPQFSAEPTVSDELRQLARTTLPPPLRPLRLHCVAQIPRLPGGKVDLARLEEMDRLARRPVAVADDPGAAGKFKTYGVVHKAWTKVLNARMAAGRWDDAGGDSLKLLHCVMEIEEAIGQELSLDGFRVDMSVDEMVRAVAAQQPGDHPTEPDKDALPLLFLLPGSVGYGPSMAAFAGSMSKVTKVAPIRYPDLHMILAGRKQLTDMAAFAAEQINRIQPKGDVRLLGHSLGGAVAFEAAALLLTAGRSIKFLGILDTSIDPEPSDHRETLRRTIHRIRTNRVSAYRMACRALAKIAVTLDWQARLAAMLDRYARGQFNATCFRVKLELQEVLRARAFFQWLDGPKPLLPVNATLFRCKREGMSRTLGWDHLCTSVDIVPIAGGHLDLVIEPHVATNRPLIERALVQTFVQAELQEGEAKAPNIRSQSLPSTV